MGLGGSAAPPTDLAPRPCSLAQSLWALFASSLAISLVFATIPFCRDVKVLASVMALAGLAMGCIDTVANMQLVRIYQKDSAVFLQVSPQQSWGREGRGSEERPQPSARARCPFLTARTVTWKEQQGQVQSDHCQLGHTGCHLWTWVFHL